MKILFRVAKTLKTYVSAQLLRLQSSCRSIDSIVQDAVLYELFITNNLGGGTRTFQKNYLAGKKNVLVLSNRTYGRDFCFVVENLDTGAACVVPASILPALLQHHQIQRITVNTLITYKCLDLMLGELCRRAKHIAVVYLVHDFYCICPVYTLTKGNSFCHVDCSQSDDCMRGINPFLTSCNAIEQWRERWSLFLQGCSEIRCFSQSSRDLVVQVYPLIPAANVTVIPHDMSQCTLRPIDTIERLPLHIGFIGDVHTIPKGKGIVRQLLRRLSTDIPITFIGNSWLQIPSIRRNTRYLGTYRPEELQLLVERQTISTVVFPSICSETFSYAVSEHIMMGLDVLCLNIGAQAEKVGKYERGYVCDSVDEMLSVIHTLRQQKMRYKGGEHP